MPHILFADDNPDTRELVKLIFTTRLPDAAISLAKDGSGAVEFIRAGVPVDIILLDYQMPPDGNGGVVAAQKIRRLRPHVPLFFLSAYTLDHTEHTARTAGAWGYLGKEAIIHREVFVALVTQDWEAFRRLSLRGHTVQLFEENISATP